MSVGKLSLKRSLESSKKKTSARGMHSSLSTRTRYWPAGLSWRDNVIAFPPPDHPTVQTRISTRKCVPAILHHRIWASASDVEPVGTCVNIEVVRERLICTLNDIQLCKCGGSFGVDASDWAFISKRLLALREMRVRRPTSAQPIMEHRQLWRL